MIANNPHLKEPVEDVLVLQESNRGGISKMDNDYGTEGDHNDRMAVSTCDGFIDVDLVAALVKAMDIPHHCTNTVMRQTD